MENYGAFRTRTTYFHIAQLVVRTRKRRYELCGSLRKVFHDRVIHLFKIIILVIVMTQECLILIIVTMV